MTMDLIDLTASEAAAKLATGEIGAEELCRAYLTRIEARDDAVMAWAALDPALALAKARELDKRRIVDGPTGPLHGLPFGVKDMIDTADLPTRNNAPGYADHRPNTDANVVRVVKAQGGYVLGKTETVEFAAKGGRRAPTRNPHDAGRTPGGSSSGSGAAVGDRQVSLAFGTQTGGSLIRPAAFNGIFALKPTWGTVSWSGARQNAHELDTIGWYGRSPDDLRIVARAFRLWGIDDPVAAKTPAIGILRGPNWDAASAATQRALEKAAVALKDAGFAVREIDLPEPFARLNAAQEVIMDSQGAVNFLPEYLDKHDSQNDTFRKLVETRGGYDPAKLVAAQDLAAECRVRFDALFDGVDAMLTPASLGEAPEGLTSTGDARMNAMWTLLHVPCLALPGATGDAGLPVGLQIVGPRYGDAALIGTADGIAPVIATLGKV